MALLITIRIVLESQVLKKANIPLSAGGLIPLRVREKENLWLSRF
jgi:hypothetical protein